MAGVIIIGSEGRVFNMDWRIGSDGRRGGVATTGEVEVVGDD